MNNNSENTDSDNIYYSPENTDSESDTETKNTTKLITCYCNKNIMKCFIFCFNNETNQFESIDCNKFKQKDNI